MFHYLVAVREYSSDFSVLSSLTLTFSGPGSPNQSCPRPRLPHTVGGRHLGRETYRSTTAQRADMQPKLHQTPLMRTTHLAGADSPKTQTTSPLAARCQRFSPRWSAMWAPHHRKLRAHRHQSGGIALHGGSTRRRHAARRLRVVQNPHHSRLKCAASPTRPGTAPVGAKNFAQHQPSSDISAKNFAQQAQKHQIWANLSAQGELFRAFTIYQRRRENFFARADVGPPVHYPSATQPPRHGGHRRTRRARPQCA